MKSTSRTNSQKSNTLYDKKLLPHQNFVHRWSLGHKQHGIMSVKM